jgi:hypothetical protein
VPGDEGPPPYEGLAGRVASLRGELADALTALEQARAELAGARERIAELGARLRQNPRHSSRPPPGEGLAVTDAAPQGQRCRATQADGALTRMQQLLSEAVSLIMLAEGKLWTAAVT